MCRWVNQADALEHFVRYDGPTQSQQHIKHLHWYVACRLVLEGGFHPDELKPRPPFTVKKRRGQLLIDFEPGAATGGEATVLGGLKTKNVDVAISKDGLGLVLAVSCKGMTGAFRNLTNRMEETIGECTNLHITYPALVFGYLFVIRANEAPDAAGLANAPPVELPVRPIAPNDIAISESRRPVESIVRFHSALGALPGRNGIREDASRYEAISLALIDTRDSRRSTFRADWRAGSVDGSRAGTFQRRELADGQRLDRGTNSVMSNRPDVGVPASGEGFAHHSPRTSGPGTVPCRSG